MKKNFDKTQLFLCWVFVYLYIPHYETGLFSVIAIPPQREKQSRKSVLIHWIATLRSR